MCSQRLSCSWKPHVCRVVLVLVPIARGPRSQRAPAVPGLDPRGQRSGVRQREVSGGDAGASAEFTAHLPRPGERDHHDPPVPPDAPRPGPDHAPRAGAAGVNTGHDQQRITHFTY